MLNQNPTSSSPEANSPAVPLCSLNRGSRAVVDHREMACDDCDLLNAMGLTDQCTLKVCRVGEPCIVEVRSTRLGLSSSVAKKIMVTSVPTDAAASDRD